MGQKRRPTNRRGPSGGRRGPVGGVQAKKLSAKEGWVLVHPRCARQRAEDIEEVRAMIAAGEDEVAIDELRWLLGECSEFIEAHQLLGELASRVDGDVQLARGHYGFAYQLGLTALKRAGMPTPLRYRLPENAAFFAAGQGLATCLMQAGKQSMADEVLRQLLRCDPSDPLGLGPIGSESS